MNGAVCSNCQYYGKLSPGQAAICFYKWRDLPWNEAVPLTRADDTCEAFTPRSTHQAEIERKDRRS